MVKFKDYCVVDYVEHMGSDIRVDEAARVSTQTITDPNRLEGIIKFLISNKHASPLEHSIITYKIEAPIFVAREWMRHRTQCLAANTPITCVQPNGVVYQRTIEHLYKTYHGVEAPERWVKNGFQQRDGTPARTLKPGTSRYRALNKNHQRVLRVFDENNRVFTTGIMNSAYQSGIKELYAVVTKDDKWGSKTVHASAEHPFLTTEGWVKVKDMMGDELIIRPGKIKAKPIGTHYPPSLRSGIGVWTTMLRPSLIGEGSTCYICGDLFKAEDMELDHIIPVYKDLTLALDIKNLAPACRPCHRAKTDGEQSSRKGLTCLGEKTTRLANKPLLVEEAMTYDIQMDGDHLNYVANHLVVHNSFNEESGRYSVIQPICFVPSINRPVVQKGKVGAYSFEPDTKLMADVQDRFYHCYEYVFSAYDDMIASGVAKEVARMILPVGAYTKWFATANLRNWLNFLVLRNDSHAMEEIRLCAKLIEHHLHELFPICMRMWVETGRPQI